MITVDDKNKMERNGKMLRLLEKKEINNAHNFILGDKLVLQILKSNQNKKFGPIILMNLDNMNEIHKFSSKAAMFFTYEL